MNKIVRPATQIANIRQDNTPSSLGSSVSLNTASALNGLSKEDLENLTGRKLFLFEKGNYLLATTLENGNLLEETGDEKLYEHFQLFNQDDSPIIIQGKQLISYRSECHGDNRLQVTRPNSEITTLCHRGIAIFIMDKNGRILVPIRSQKKDLYKGKYDVSVGEHLKVGESYIDGAIRGASEELGIKIEASSLTEFGRQMVASNEQTERGVFFRLVLDHKDFSLSSETDSVTYMNINSLREQDLNPESFPFRDDMFPIFKKFIETA